MFNMPGGSEMLLIFAAIVLMFGGAKLPGLGKALGEGIKNFKKGVKDEENPKVEGNEDANTKDQGHKK